jgi:hypothetical protein
MSRTKVNFQANNFNKRNSYLRPINITYFSVWTLYSNALFNWGKIALVNVETLAREQDIIVLHTHTQHTYRAPFGGRRRWFAAAADVMIDWSEQIIICLIVISGGGVFWASEWKCCSHADPGSPPDVYNAIFNIHLDTTGGVAWKIKLCVCVCVCSGCRTDRALSRMGFLQHTPCTESSLYLNPVFLSY